MRATGERVRSAVGCALAVTDLVPQSQKLGESFLLPDCRQTLIIKMDQAALICADQKFIMMEIGPPLFYRHEYGQTLFFVRGQVSVLGSQRFTHVCNRMPPLLQHCTHSVFTCAGIDDELLGKIW